MVKTLFQNSKAALIFAGLTIFGATAMVGSQDDSGVLLKAVSVAEARGNRNAAEAQSSAAPPPSVFGEYSAKTEGAAAPETAASPSAAPITGTTGGTTNPMTAPLSPTALAAPASTATPQ